jgi:hypothetical protein
MTNPNPPKPESASKPQPRPDVAMVMEALKHSDDTPKEQR